MPYLDDDLLPISALQHLQFCERQCALIHIEGAWAENVYTTEGRHMHERAHEESTRLEGGVLVARGLRLRSLTLGLTGQADVVEFHPDEERGVELPRRRGKWHPFPVEYKRGKPKRDHCDEVQLCAQAICLEEMLGVIIPEGALFYGKTRRRFAVTLDEALRVETTDLARRLHELIGSRQTPPPVYSKAKCESCSLISLCLPRSAGARGAVDAWIRKQIEDPSSMPAGEDV